MKNFKFTVLMKYHYRGELRTKYVTLEEVAKRTSNGYYQRRVNAARGLDEVQSPLGLCCGKAAAEELPTADKGVYE